MADGEETLMNTNDRYRDIKRNICGYAQQDKTIKAVIAIGSSTRSNIPADEYSDLDLIIVTDSPDRWYSGEYQELFGNVSISFIEPTLGGGRERRCIYDDDKDVDMIIFTPEQFGKALREGAVQCVMNRGYALLYDSGDYADLIPKFFTPAVSRSKMNEEEFSNTVNDFYFHNIWACKKLRRGELWSAKMCIDAYLKNLLLKMIEQYQLCISDADVWHDGRFLDLWADKSVLDELKHCFAHYAPDDCKRAIAATHRLFARLARAVADKNSHAYPESAEKCALSYIITTTNIKDSSWKEH
jgi:aminoglycoside 6-adenylyltransferase